MQNRSKALLWSASAISFIMAIILVFNDSSGPAAFFALMGIIYIAATRRADQALAGSNPNLARWGVIAATVLLVLLVVVVGAVLLL